VVIGRCSLDVRVCYCPSRDREKEKKKKSKNSVTDQDNGPRRLGKRGGWRNVGLYGCGMLCLEGKNPIAFGYAVRMCILDIISNRTRTHTGTTFLIQANHFHIHLIATDCWVVIR